MTSRCSLLLTPQWAGGLNPAHTALRDVKEMNMADFTKPFTVETAALDAVRRGRELADA